MVANFAVAMSTKFWRLFGNWNIPVFSKEKLTFNPYNKYVNMFFGNFSIIMSAFGQFVYGFLQFCTNAEIQYSRSNIAEEITM